MEKIAFELTNEQRRYLALSPVEDGWDLVKLGSGEFSSEIYLYFDADVIRKMIELSPWWYIELELNETATANRTLLLPHTPEGEAVKLDVAATKSFRQSFYFSFTSGFVTIANRETFTTYYTETFEKGKRLYDLPDWLDGWITGTTEADLRELKAFRHANAQNIECRQGDFFAFKLGRRQWGFGRILVMIPALNDEQKPFGLYNSFGKNPDTLLVNIYHKTSNTPSADLDELANCMALPGEFIRRKPYFNNGEYKIIGNRNLEAGELGEMVISYARSHDLSPDIVWLHCGAIYRQAPLSEFSKYLPIHKTESPGENNPYEMGYMSISPDIETLAECIAAGSNAPYWNRERNYHQLWDLRNPLNYQKKKEIFSFFGLDADKTYEENLDLIHEGI